MLWTLTIARASLSLADLVITNNPEAGAFWLPEEGLEEPDTTYRLGYMPDSRDVHGKELIAAALEHSALPVTVYTKAVDVATLAAQKATLRAALGQFAYSVTLDVDGDANTYSADPCGPRWGPVDSGMVRARMAKASFTIPVYPIAS